MQRHKPNTTTTTTKDYSTDIFHIHSTYPNNICFDCGITGTTYFVINTGTFVCSKCAGVLRELHFKVKGLSVSHFNIKDKAIAELCGNDKAYHIFMGKFDNKKHKKLNHNSDVKLFKRFIKDKYIRLLFCVKGKEYKHLQELLDMNNKDDDDDDESSNEDSDDEEEEEESDSESVDDSDNSNDDKCNTNTNYNDNAVKKETLTKLCEMKIKKPSSLNNTNNSNTNSNSNTVRTVNNEYKESHDQWRTMWEKTDGINRYVNINDFEFINEDNN
jgi:hypothetical protein